jgi:hypothetical protein
MNNAELATNLLWLGQKVPPSARREVRHGLIEGPRVAQERVESLGSNLGKRSNGRSVLVMAAAAECSSHRWLDCWHHGF